MIQRYCPGAWERTGIVPIQLCCNTLEVRAKAGVCGVFFGREYCQSREITDRTAVHIMVVYTVDCPYNSTVTSQGVDVDAAQVSARIYYKSLISSWFTIPQRGRKEHCKEGTYTVLHTKKLEHPTEATEAHMEYLLTYSLSLSLSPSVVPSVILTSHSCLIAFLLPSSFLFNLLLPYPSTLYC